MAVNGGKLCWDGTARSGGINSTAASAWWPLRICTGSSAASNRTNVTVLRPIRREREGGGHVSTAGKKSHRLLQHALVGGHAGRQNAGAVHLDVCVLQVQHLQRRVEPQGVSKRPKPLEIFAFFAGNVVQGHIQRRGRLCKRGAWR